MSKFFTTAGFLVILLAGLILSPILFGMTLITLVIVTIIFTIALILFLTEV